MTHRIVEVMTELGKQGRLAVTSNVGRQPVFFDPRYQVRSGPAYVICARIRDFFKGQAFLADGNSHVFVDEVVVRDLNKDPAYAGTLICRTTGGQARLRGNGIPELDIFEYDLRGFGSSSPTAGTQST